jgi:membrane protease YdiL (CAAX protease family)
LSVPTRRIVRAEATSPSGRLQDLYWLADDDGMQDVVLARAPIRPWPPVAERHRAEPSPLAIALLLGAATWATHALGAWVPRGATPMRGVWWLAGVDALRLAIWLAIVAAPAWWRPAGLGRGVRSAWALIPLGAVAVAAASAGWPGASPNGSSFGLLLAASSALGALREEVVFRGLVFHWVAIRLGGTGAVIGSSALFAIAHVPRYVWEDRTAAEMAAELIVVFCMGLFLCRVRAATGSIWMPAAIHALWNVAVTGVALPEAPAAVTFAYAAPFAVGAVLFLSLVLPTMCPRTFGRVGAFAILGTDRVVARQADATA